MYCECGCGDITPIAERNNRARGWVKGNHIRFIHGHNCKTEEGKRNLGQRGEENHLWKGNEACPESGRDRGRRLYKKLGKCDLCEEPATDRHHRDQNTKNNSRSNVMFLCEKHHVWQHCAGERSPNHKLMETQVIEIMHLLEKQVPQVKIADIFGVARTTIGSIAIGKSWRYLNAA